MCLWGLDHIDCRCRPAPSASTQAAESNIYQLVIDEQKKTDLIGRELERKNLDLTHREQALQLEKRIFQEKEAHVALLEKLVEQQTGPNSSAKLLANYVFGVLSAVFVMYMIHIIYV